MAVSNATVLDAKAEVSEKKLSSGKEAGLLAALLIALLLGALDIFIVVTALPKIASDLNDVSGQVFVISGYLIAQTVAIPLFGKLSDRYGRRSFFLLGLGIFLFGSVLAGLSQNLNELIAFRAVQGVGSGAFFTVVFSIVAEVFPPEAAARVAGLLSGVFGVAIVFGPLIGSYIVDHTTWRWIFFVNLPIGFAAVGLVIATLPATKPNVVSRPFDSLGAGLLAVWVGALIFALVETSHGWAWTDPRTIGLIALSLVLIPVFLWVESRAVDPLVPLKYFRNRLIAASSAVNFLRGAVLVAAATFVPILVVYGLGGSTDDGRNVLYAFMIPMIVGAALAGGILPRTGFGAPVSVGLAFVTLGAILLALVPTQPPIYRFVGGIFPVGLMGALIPLGFGVGMTFAPTQMAIQYSVPRNEIGTGTSLVWFLSNLGGSIVVSILGTYQQNVYTSLSPSGPPPMPGTPAYFAYLGQFQTAFAQSIQHVWVALIPVAIAGLIAALLIRGRLPATEAGSSAPVVM
ncbi:MAG TPA: MFS transporter [Thermoplasmata archaeon]|nr:MFS transporter [Thermoplasmata archaeon]